MPWMGCSPNMLGLRRHTLGFCDKSLMVKKKMPAYAIA